MILRPHRNRLGDKIFEQLLVLKNRQKVENAGFNSKKKFRAA